MDAQALYSLGTLLAFAGIIIIGPIPIILGSGPNAQSLTLLAITLTTLCIAATLLLNRRPRDKNS